MSAKHLEAVLVRWEEAYHGTTQKIAVHISAVDLMVCFQVVAVLDLLTVVVTAVGAQD